MVKFLSTFDGVNNSSSDKDIILDAALRATLGSCENPLLFAQRDSLLASKAVSSLKNDAKFKPAYELLNIVAGDNLDSFFNFEKANPEFIGRSGLHRTELEESMRLLTLCSLAVLHEEVSYSKVATALHVPETDVEYWVVLAITRNLIEARMDQLAKSILMTRSRSRVFDDTQWKILSKRLHEWKASVAKMIDSIQASKDGMRHE